MSSNIVGCFDNPADARAVEQELVGSGIPRQQVHLVAERERQQSRATEEPGFWESIKEAFGFADETDRSMYEEAARRGSVIVSADVPDNAIDRAVGIMRRHNVVDLDQREAQWRQQGWAGVPSAQQMRQPTRQAQQTQQTQQQQRRTGEQEVIPVVEEQLRVGKRQVQQGGVRVYSHVTEKPIEEQVNLRQERVDVERRPVDRPIRDTDDAFRERKIEARQTSEEAVVDKQARVVEEVALRKDVEQRSETVRDKVRRTDVEVEKIPGSERIASTAGDPTDLFIREISANQSYRGRDWASSEPEIRRSFEQRFPGNRWDQYRDRIRRGMESRA